jgi:16S rRNA (cytosine967-C5)-methyltransferase
MKIHRPIAEKVVSALQQIFNEGYQADKVLERMFKFNRQLGARDRRFIAEATYDIVRWRRLLQYAGGVEPHDPALPISFWPILAAWLIQQGNSTLPEWQEFTDLDTHLIKTRLNSPDLSLAIRESFPDWLYELGQREMGDRWPGLMRQLNSQAPVVIRANRIKTDRHHLKQILEKEGTQTFEAPHTEDGLILNERKNLFSADSFKSGLFEVQDGASQQVAPLLNAQPGDRVIDACAGAGGKTLHLAGIMKNKGKIIAMDVHPKKLDELRRRCSRGGVDIVETRMIESNKTIKRLENTADRVLLDVPCSGLGVLRRNPDSKWRLKPEDLVNLKKLQADILATYSAMVKPGGILVYATCSILPSENEDQVTNFLVSREADWELMNERKFMPGEDGYDGFYAAQLRRLK